MATEKVRAHAIIRGKVQGVFFRAETKQAAERIGDISGWVKNRRDGAVEAVFEGPRNRVEEMIQWCKKGSPPARVSDVHVDWETYDDAFEGFDIRR